MYCPACCHEFDTSDVKEQKPMLIAPLVKCPNCEHWLRHDAKSGYFKIVALLLCLIASFGVYGLSPESNKLLSYSLFVGGFFVFLFSFKLTKLLLSPEPSQT
jgi:hypothetical protein